MAAKQYTARQWREDHPDAELDECPIGLVAMELLSGMRLEAHPAGDLSAHQEDPTREECRRAVGTTRLSGPVPEWPTGGRVPAVQEHAVEVAAILDEVYRAQREEYGPREEICFEPNCIELAKFIYVRGDDTDHAAAMVALAPIARRAMTRKFGKGTTK